MSAFKELVEKDNEMVFMDMDIFAEEHRVATETIPCIIQDDTLQEGTSEFPITKNVKTLHAQSRDLPDEMGYGETLMVDGVPYMVLSWKQNMGMATITLDINDSV